MIRLDKGQLLEIQRNRPPFLLMDEAFDIIVDRQASSRYTFREDFFLFPVHFPGDPDVPASIQLEAMTQTGAIPLLINERHHGEVCYVAGVRVLRCRRKILPNDTLFVSTQIKFLKHGYARVIGTGYVDSELAVEAEFELILPSVFKPIKGNQ